MPVLIMFVGCFKKTHLLIIFSKKSSCETVRPFLLGDETFGHKMPVKTGLQVVHGRHGPSNWFFWCAVALWRRHDRPFGLLRLQQWNEWSLNGMFVSVRSRSLYLCNLYCVFCTPLMIFLNGWASFAQVSSR